jgi:hypothetical protein
LFTLMVIIFYLDRIIARSHCFEITCLTVFFGSYRYGYAALSVFLPLYEHAVKIVRFSLATPKTGSHIL